MDFRARTVRRRSRGGAIRLLSVDDFRYEVQTERMRAVRRGIPFCVLKLKLRGKSRSKSEMKRLLSLVLRNVRATDEKSLLGRFVIGLLLVDTPEMGGRTVVDRLEDLCLRAGFDIVITLKTYDPDSFGDEDKSVPGERNASTSEAGILSLPGDRQVRVDQPLVVDFAPTTVLSQFTKRSIDLTVASIGLVAAAPVLLAAAAAIRLTSPGPAFFTQIREGRGGKPFKIFKLRTMYVDAEARQASLRALSERDGPAFKMKDDPRVTRVGSFLRSSCIDELPQLINVLLGQMSIVGPRPLPLAESRACAAWHRRRLDVRPGLTCDWQINKRAVETFDDWMRLDLAYVDRGGVIKDLWLMVQTLRVPIGGRGGE